MGIEPKDYDHGRFYSSQPMPLIYRRRVFAVELIPVNLAVSHPANLTKLGFVNVCTVAHIHLPFCNESYLLPQP